MIKIALDEQGKFETDRTSLLFIGGFLFDDKGNEYELSNEIKRIRAYYKSVLSKVNPELAYPRDLHPNGDGQRNSEVIAPVKQMFDDTIPEFLSFGTVDGEELRDESGETIFPRKGEYHLFVYFKSAEGKKGLGGNNDMMIRDSFASNLYFHMSQSVVHRIILNNPLYFTPQNNNKGTAKNDVLSLDLELSTRSSAPIDTLDQRLIKEYIKQGFKLSEAKTNSEYKYYSVMNEDIYRTLLAEEMNREKMSDVEISHFTVKSMYYGDDAKYMEYQYLADTLCACIGYKLTENKEDWIYAFDERLDLLNPKSKNLVFAYDDIDDYYNRAWDHYKKGRVIEALSEIYDAGVRKGNCSNYYKEKWFCELEDRLIKDITVNSFSDATHDAFRLINTNNLDQDKLLFIQQQLEKMSSVVADKYDSEESRAVALFNLYEVGMSAYCHIGDSENALIYYEKAKKYAAYADFESFLRISNKLVVCLEDSFEWDKAEIIAKDIVGYQELASDMKRSIFDNDLEYVHEGKAISQHARVLAVMRDANAEEEFRKSLNKFEKGSANYKITQSYLLHFLADMGYKEKFEEELTDYMDGMSSYPERINALLKMTADRNAPIHKSYALYIVIRGLYCFGDDNIDSGLWAKLRDIETHIKTVDKKEPQGHPWELIYKYIELIALKKGALKYAEKYEDMRHKCLRNEGKTITALNMYSDAEISDMKQDKNDRNAICDELVHFLKANFSAFSDRVFSNNADERYNELGQVFAFMYK